MTVAKFIALFVFSVAVVALRRPDQIAAPILWFEEGRFILRNYADCGAWFALSTSIHGNMALSAKLLLLPVLKVAIFQAPTIAAALGIAFNAAVACAIAFAPTHLRARYLCALAVLLVPMGTENFGTVLYSVWWCAILIALALLWDTSKGLHWLRLAFLVLGGLSTPFMIGAAPLFVVRAYRERTAREVGLALLAIVLAFVAAVSSLRSNTLQQPFDASFTADGALLTVSKFFGLYLWPMPAPDASLAAGAVLVLALLVLAWLARRNLDFYFALLVMLLVASIAANLVRAPMADIHPWGSGSRYFFLTYAFIGFILLWLWSILPMSVKAVPLLILAVSIAGAARQPFFTHPVQERKPWPAALVFCAETPGMNPLPLGYNTSMMLRQEGCRALIDGSLINTHPL